DPSGGLGGDGHRGAAMRTPLFVALLLVGACQARTVEIDGVVLAERGTTELLDRGTITIRDRSGERYAQADIGGDGTFRVEAPAGSNIFAVVEAEGLTP